MDIGRVLKDSWAIFAKDWGALILAALITFALGIVTLGVLSVALSAGLYNMILRACATGRKARAGDVFACFDRLGAYVVAYLLLLALLAGARPGRGPAGRCCSSSPTRAPVRSASCCSCWPPARRPSCSPTWRRCGSTGRSSWSTGGAP